MFHLHMVERKSAETPSVGEQNVAIKSFTSNIHVKSKRKDSGLISYKHITSNISIVDELTIILFAVAIRPCTATCICYSYGSQKISLGFSVIANSCLSKLLYLPLEGLRWLPTVLTVSTPEKGRRTKNELFGNCVTVKPKTKALLYQIKESSKIPTLNLRWLLSTPEKG